MKLRNAAEAKMIADKSKRLSSSKNSLVMTPQNIKL
jgi:hypothetical protein